MQITFRHVLSTIVWILIITLIFIFHDRLNVGSNTPLRGINDIAKVVGCTIQNNRCVFVIDQQKFDVIFLQTPVPEEEIQFSVTSPDDFSLLSGWVEGGSMYMGKTPVIVENQNNNSFKALLFLGSCNLKTMEWRMVLNFKQKAHPVEVRFTTSIE